MTRSDIILKYFPQAQSSVAQFEMLEALYGEWNAKINVISRKDMDELYLHHVLHSLAIAAFLRNEMPQLFEQGISGNPSQDIRILDLGTGGGFPGIPLAILFPGFRFTLCDSIGKKVRVAGAVAEALGLKNVTTVHSRAEELKETYDYIVSRAVTSLDNFLPWVKGKYTKGILYLKGGDIVEELSVAAMKNNLNMKNISVHDIGRWFKEEYFSEKKVVFICKSN